MAMQALHRQTVTAEHLPDGNRGRSSTTVACLRMGMSTFGYIRGGHKGPQSGGGVAQKSVQIGLQALYLGRKVVPWAHFDAGGTYVRLNPSIVRLIPIEFCAPLFPPPDRSSIELPHE